MTRNMDISISGDHVKIVIELDEETLKNITFAMIIYRDVLLRKNCCSFGCCPNEGERGGPCPNFLSPFYEYIFGQ